MHRSEILSQRLRHSIRHVVFRNICRKFLWTSFLFSFDFFFKLQIASNEHAFQKMTPLEILNRLKDWSPRRPNTISETLWQLIISLFVIKHEPLDWQDNFLFFISKVASKSCRSASKLWCDLDLSRYSVYIEFGYWRRTQSDQTNCKTCHRTTDWLKVFLSLKY